jgi:hypothetical protein
MECHSTLVSWHHLRMAMLVISVPLSETIVLDFPRLAMRLFILSSRKVVPPTGMCRQPDKGIRV